MKIYTFGDSHRLHISHETLNPDIEVIYSFGNSYTMARFGLEKTKLIDISKFGVTNGDGVLFSFGEIDCRCHLCKPNNFPNYQDIVDYNVQQYFDAIKSNIKKLENITVFVYNVVPPCKLTPEILEKWGPDSGDLYPVIGTDDQRKKVSIYTNKKLKEYCEKNNYVFFDIYEKYCDDDGFLDVKYKDAFIHIINTIFVSEFLNKFFLK